MLCFLSVAKCSSYVMFNLCITQPIKSILLQFQPKAPVVLVKRPTSLTVKIVNSYDKST